MEMFNFKRLVPAIASLVLIGFGASAQAATLTVNCGGRVGLTSIGAALKAVQFAGPSTINVSGACHENVVIQSIDRLTLNSVNGASIVDASAGNLTTVTIEDSRDVTLNNFTVSGGADGIDCEGSSLCRLNGDTVENSPQGAGVFVGADSFADIIGGALQNNANFAGLQVSNGGKAKLIGVSVHGNAVGLFVNNGAFVQFVSSSSSANGAFGIQVLQGSSVVCGSCTVTGNSADGIVVTQSSNVTLTSDFSVANPPGYTVTGNGGAGVSLQGLSGATFAAPGTVSPNSGPLDVACSPSFSAAPNPPAPARTNCPAGP